MLIALIVMLIKKEIVVAIGDGGSHVGDRCCYGNIAMTILVVYKPSRNTDYKYFLRIIPSNRFHNTFLQKFAQTT